MELDLRTDGMHKLREKEGVEDATQVYYLDNRHTEVSPTNTGRQRFSEEVNTGKVGKERRKNWVSSGGYWILRSYGKSKEKGLEDSWIDGPILQGSSRPETPIWESAVCR